MAKQELAQKQLNGEKVDSISEIGTEYDRLEEEANALINKVVRVMEATAETEGGT